MFVLITFAFIAGIVTILSPCILPMLPILLSSSAAGGRRRALGVILGFVASFTFFTLFLSAIVRATGIPADSLRVLSIVVIFGFGLVLVLPQLQRQFEKIATRFAGLTPQVKQSGLVGGLLVGLSLGLLWTPCVGPILAAVISLALTGSVGWSAAAITLAYALGTAIPMFVILITGSQLFQKIPGLVNKTRQIQQLFGVVMILTAVGIGFNLDRQFQVWVLDRFPQYGAGLTSLEDNELVREQLEQLQDEDSMVPASGQPMFEMNQDSSELPDLFEAPELIPGGDWFNTEPLTLSDLKGKVVLIDFWTYSCINCIRTLPYLRDWHAQYADQGLVIIGVHSPEFAFERSTKNVAEAVDDFEIEYPVMQDNEFATWRAYRNRYWPAKYLIDQTGRVRYSHFGEGKYLETENAIRQLLEEDPVQEVSTSDQENLQSPPRRRQTPEIYLGAKRAGHYLQTDLQPGQNTVELTEPLLANTVGLTGSWNITDEFAEATSSRARLDLDFTGQQVFLVMEAADDAVTPQVQVLINDQPLPTDYRTTDTDANGMITIDQPRKYDLIDLGNDYGRHHLTLIFEPGVRAFAFTFGS